MIFAHAHIISPGFSLFYLFWGCHSACFRVAAHTPDTARLGGKLDIHIYIYTGKMTSFSPIEAIHTYHLGITKSHRSNW